MVRLRNVQTGAVVSCSEETAARLGSEWQSSDAAEAVTPAEAKSTPARRSAPKPKSE